MGLLLTILKLIGILLLILLLVLIVFAFYPISYELDIGVNQGKIQLHIFARWLFRIFALEYDKAGGHNRNYFRILWFKRRSRKGKDQEKEGALDTEASLQEDSSRHSTAEGSSKSLGAGEPDTENDPDEPDGDGEEDAGIFKRIQDILDKVKYYWDYPDRDKIVALSFLLMKRLYRWNKPKKVWASGIIGFSDPCHTGYLIGIMGMIQAIVQLDIRIKGNFERQGIELAGAIKGRLSFFTLFWPMVFFILSKPVRPIVKDILFSKKDKGYDERKESYVQ